MTRIQFVTAVVLTVGVASQAQAESCAIQSASPPGQWKFVRAYDLDTGEIVYQQAINGGDRKFVTVSGERVKVDTKLPGHTKYKAGAAASCKGGNPIKV